MSYGAYQEGSGSSAEHRGMHECRPTCNADLVRLAWDAVMTCSFHPPTADPQLITQYEVKGKGHSGRSAAASWLEAFSVPMSWALEPAR